LAAEAELKRANEAVEQARKIVENLEKEIKTLQTQLATFIQERNQLEQQCREATNLVEQTRYDKKRQFQIDRFFC